MGYIKDIDTKQTQLEKYTEYLDNRNIANALASVVDPNRTKASLDKAYAKLNEYFKLSRQIDTVDPSDRDHSLDFHRWLFEKIFAHKDELKCDNEQQTNQELLEIARFFTSEVGDLFLQGAMTNIFGKPQRVYVAKLISDYVDKALYDKSKTPNNGKNAFLASPEFAEIKKLARKYEDYRDKYGAKYIKYVDVKAAGTNIIRPFGLFYTYKPIGNGLLQPYIDVDLDPEIGTIVEKKDIEKNK